NAVLLKGGREARRSNAALVRHLRDTLRAQGFDPGAVSLLEERAEVDALLGLEREIDLVIARGSTAFVRHVQSRTSIPVLGHAKGGSAPAGTGTERPWGGPGAGPARFAARGARRRGGGERRGCEATRAKYPELVAATEADWSTEYGGLVLAVRRVDHLDDALAH